ncbi:MAG: cysteine hydrolase [Alphaproteobacteria bacterium]|nr:cysteine hydrolase [Alphaproteobacteria bacterium]
MHPFRIPPELAARVEARCGTPHPFATLQAQRTAFVVVDMQNAYMDIAHGHAVCAMAPRIVPAVNRLAAAIRAAGGLVVWIQTAHDATDLEDWSVIYAMMNESAGARRIQALTRGSAGHALWHELDVRPEDEIVEKRRFSAFIQGSSELESRLRAHGVDTVLVGGTVTGVCCESTARDAMMRNFRAVMVSDACAAQSDADHAAALCGFHSFFGDVLTVAECEDGFMRGAQQQVAIFTGV